MFSRTFISLVAVAVLAPGSALAQGADAKSLDQRTQREVVASLEAALQRNYVFQDRIPAISAELDRRVQATPIDADQFARVGTQQRPAQPGAAAGIQHRACCIGCAQHLGLI